jgi:hypothetical protein
MAETKYLARWDTRRAVTVSFSIAWLYGAFRAGTEYQWSMGTEVIVSIIFQGIGAGAFAAFIAWLVCRWHNRVASQQQNKSN